MLSGAENDDLRVTIRRNPQELGEQLGKPWH